MGKTKKRYLVNRILAMILAVAMSVTMVPSTALAAPADDPEAAIVNDTADGNGDANAPTEDEKGDPAADTPANGDVNAGAANVPADGSTAGSDQGADDNAAGSDQSADDNAAGSDQNADDNAAGSGQNADDNASTTDGETKPDADEQTSAAKPVYKIALDDEFARKAEYNGTYPFADILNHVSLLDANGDAADAAEQAKITCAWKVKGADDAYAALTERRKMRAATGLCSPIRRWRACMTARS